MHERRTLTRFGVIAGAALIAVGVAAFPAYTGADKGGNGNGNGGGNGNGNGNGRGNGDATAESNDNGNGNGGGVDKVMICHVPPGNPANDHTIVVGEPAVDAHMENHDDTMGPCDADTTTTTSTSTSTTSTSTTSTTTPETTTTTSTTTVAPTTTSSSTTTTGVVEQAIAVSFTPTFDPLFCNVVVDLTGFAPSSTFDVVVTHSSPILINPASPWTFPGVATDAAGAAQLVPFSYFQGLPEDASFTAEADGVTSASANVDC